MAQNLVSVSISPESIANAEKNVRVAIEILTPFIEGLTKAQREELTKMGDKSVAFAQKVNSYMSTNPAYIPAHINQEEYNKDFAVPAALNNLHGLVQSLFEMVDDTVMAAGSDVMDVSNQYYGSVRNAASHGEAGAKAIYDDLKARYPGRATKHTVA